MSTMPTTRRTFGEGPLSRATALVYTLLVVEGMLVVTTGPTLVVLTLLERDASNVPLVTLAAVPLGPAVAAALTALRAPRDITDLRPAAEFWRGYRRDARQVLALWVPALLVLTVVAVNLAHLDAGGVPRAWAVPLWVIGVVAALWAVDATTIVSQFAFRSRDVARLSLWFLLAAPGVTLGVLGVLMTAAVVVTLSSEAVLLLGGSLFTGMLLLVTRPLAARVERDFVA